MADVRKAIGKAAPAYGPMAGVRPVSNVTVIIGEDAAVWTMGEVARRWDDICAVARGRAITLVLVPEPPRWPKGSRGPDVLTCSAGHPWADATYIPPTGRRACRPCRTAYMARRRALARDRS